MQSLIISSAAYSSESSTSHKGEASKVEPELAMLSHANVVGPSNAYIRIKPRLRGSIDYWTVYDVLSFLEDPDVSVKDLR